MLRATIRLAFIGTLATGIVSLQPMAAQTAETQPKEVISNGGLLHTLEAAPVTGQPFSAIQVQKRNKKLEDGTNIAHFGHHSVARDSSGRVRVERPCGCKEGDIVIAVYVFDPTAHTLTTWREGANSDKLATQIKLTDTLLQPKAQPVKLARNDSRPQPIITTETLPTEFIDSLPMAVTKTTTIVPPGRSGNDQPITKTHEVWASEDLKLTFKEEWVDPRAATRTVELDKFSRAEPDPTLFRAPRDYKVKDMKQTMKELSEALEKMSSAM